MQDLALITPFAVVITAVLPYSGAGVCNVLETHAHKYPHVTRCILGAVLYQALDEFGNVTLEQRVEEGQWVWVEEGKRHRIKTLTERWAYQCEHWDHENAVLDIESHSSVGAV